MIFHLSLFKPIINSNFSAKVTAHINISKLFKLNLNKFNILTRRTAKPKYKTYKTPHEINAITKEYTYILMIYKKNLQDMTS
ncbi:hypothetical protein VQ01_02785 [Tamlana sp. s12]|nr:hypothetical protein VQ01_02785 [Tamlana sp. s12]